MAGRRPAAAARVLPVAWKHVYGGMAAQRVSRRLAPAGRMELLSGYTRQRETDHGSSVWRGTVLRCGSATGLGAVLCFELQTTRTLPRSGVMLPHTLSARLGHPPTAAAPWSRVACICDQGALHHLSPTSWASARTCEWKLSLPRNFSSCAVCRSFTDMMKRAICLSVDRPARSSRGSQGYRAVV